MTSRRKLTVTLTVVALVVVAAVVAVVGVLAATQQTVQSTINITFTAVDIDGTVSARYGVQKKTETSLTGGTACEDSIVFKAADTTATGSLAIGGQSDDTAINIKGESEALYVTYEFTREEIDYTVSATFSDTDFKMEYYDTDESKWVEVGSSAVTMLDSISDGAGTSVTTRFYVKDAKTSIKNFKGLTVQFVLTGTTHEA